ncbi:PAS domain-containing protein [Sphingomonadaceae bacterium OTU29LAMAA1]|nr:PAS domain-containing protein [Sphingomonadaceae bacterium OTU29LAMAA1]
MVRSCAWRHTLSTPPPPFPVVGIGASAGGVEALQALFGDMPVDTGAAFVVVTHVSPDRISMLPEILGRSTTMPVEAAADGVAVQPDHVYVLPAHGVLGFSDGCLRMVPPRPGTRERKPVDIFLSALARDKREFSAGIILSGGDSDGTLGVKAIKERGGLTMAQVADGNPPQNPDMPDSAISTGMIDFAVPVQDMGARVQEFARSFSVLDGLTVAAANEDHDSGEAESLSEIYALLRAQMGHDFSGYKTKTFLRRVQRRMQVTRAETIGLYVECLRQDPKEVSALFRDLLINVTNFFRDADAFEALKAQVIPKLFEGRSAEDTVRVWVPGCATGEEVFSIAMLMREHIDTLRNVPRVQLFATDIDDRALSVARAARYPEALLDSVSADRRNRFFVADGGSYVVTKDIRDMCIFSPHSILRDPPFSRIDLVSCRNLLIYFGSDAQNQVIPTFRYALRPGGYLFLGTSEGISQFDDLFVPLDKKHRLFRARDDGGPPPRLPLAVPGVRTALLPLSGITRGKTLPLAPLRQAVELHVLDRHAPPHVVVTGEGDIVYYSSRTGKYFEAPAGVPNRQLLAMARKGLRLDLRSAFRDAIETGRSVVCEGVEFENDDGRIQQLSLAVEPLTGASDERLYLIVFKDYGPTLTPEQARLRPHGDEANYQIERELRETRERLQSMIEEYETALEELKSSNEELVSVNEELQSTNEEMEASKEELQALNEELNTVNSELSHKVDALDHANADLENLFEVTDIATIFLDRQLVIRMFTPAATRIFTILPGDRGRPLTDLSTRLEFPELVTDLQQVLATGRPVERQVAGVERTSHYLARIMPYRDGDGATTGVAVTVMDVTGLAEAEAHQRVLIAELNHRVKNMLAVVAAIASRTQRNARDLDEFYGAFSGRLGAMTRAYELLSRDAWRTVQLRDLATRELEPFGIDRVAFLGEDVMLGPRSALSVAMILHEMTTNAAKYGALSIDQGRVELFTERANAGDERGGDAVRLDWRERDGPECTAPEREGFGMQLVRNEASYNLRGVATVDFRPEGLALSLRFDDKDGNTASPRPTGGR